MGLEIFLRDRKEFAATTENEIVKIFVKLELSEEKLDLENFCPKRQKGVGLRIICPSKREKESKVKQVRRGVRGPVR